MREEERRSVFRRLVLRLETGEQGRRGVVWDSPAKRSNVFWTLSII